MYRLAQGARPRLGLFVGGFRWSGSGAVADWLLGHEGINAPRFTEKAFGEIRAINYGVRFAIKAAEGRGIGARLGRFALCPDRLMAQKRLGPLAMPYKGCARAFLSVVDAAFFAAAAFRVTPSYRDYKPMLNGQLGQDFLCDDEYLLAAERFYEACRSRAVGDRGEPDEANGREGISRSLSALVALFYDRLGGNASIPLFENAFSGLDPRLVAALNGECFPKLAFILVYRDPRDQFIDLLRYSGSTFPWSYRTFCASYRRGVESARGFLACQGTADPGRFYRLIRFEDFVLDAGGARSRLKSDLEKFWAGASRPQGAWNVGSFDPERSAKNIGMWKYAKDTHGLRYITKNLREFLFER